MSRPPVKAVRLVREHRGDYSSEYAAIKAISAGLGMTAETLRQWVGQAEVDAGQAEGVTSQTARELREFRRKNAELERTIEILEGGEGVLRAGVRPATPLICAFIEQHRQEFGVAPICHALTELGVPIAPRTYHAQVARPPSKRALWDMTVTELLAGYDEPDEAGRRPPESL